LYLNDSGDIEMTYSFIQDVPANEQIYSQILAGLGDTTPPGLISHVVIKRDGGLRYVDVWESQRDWEQFRDERVEPTVAKVLASYGIPHNHDLTSFQQDDIIHVWTATS
jgi:hypothetical protein